MGCDIHLHTEIKVDGQWRHYSHPHVVRSYAVFAKMAGVRGDEEPIAQPRGVPEDASFVTRFDYDRWPEDWHTPSWLGAEEIVQLVEYIDKVLKFPGEAGVGRWSTENFGYLFGNSFEGFHEYPEDRDAGVEDVRFVFWFDN